MILCIRENDFDILFNEDLVNNDLPSVQTMIMCGKVRASMSKAMQHPDGEAKVRVLLCVGQKVAQAYHELEQRFDAKISDPNLISDELKNYGEFVTPEDVKRGLSYRIL